jgi:hypothetical protein
MGQGLGIAFVTFGARVEGTRMADLKGAMDNISLQSSGLRIELPTEQTYSVTGHRAKTSCPRHL